jgi:energy-coupling factor transporter transmembrane protein EcfT
MDIHYLDYLSSRKISFLHRMNAGKKLILFLIALFSIIMVQSVPILFLIYVAIIAVTLATRLPFSKLFVFSLYPVVFVLIFVFSVPAIYFLEIVLKILGASMLAVLVVSTTPYFEIFKAMSIVLPGIITQIMFIAYRSIFIILDMMSVMFSTLKLRGGIDSGKPKRTLKLMGRSFGYLLIRSADMAERMNDITYLRGFDL